MRRLIVLIALLLLHPVAAHAQLYPRPAFNPVAEYVTAGQDEPGYRAWYKTHPWRPTYVRAFHNYLVTYGVSGVAPTWQLLRTATDWQRCGADPFEVPPTSEWPNIVATLKYVGQYIVPAIGPVEPVSVYRNPALNVCAGGAQTSTHRDMGAIDIVPLRVTNRMALMLDLCGVHLAHADQPIGLGFYKGLRFHIDARKFREWGTASGQGSYGCRAVLAESGRRVPLPPLPLPAPAVPLVVTTPIGAPPAPAPAPPTADPLPQLDPLAPKADTQSP